MTVLSVSPALECCLRGHILVFLRAQHIYFDMYVFAHRQWRWTIVIRKGTWMSIKVLTSASHAFIFLLFGLGFHLFLGTILQPIVVYLPGWLKRWRATRSFCDILTMLGLCGYGLGDCSDECNFLLFYLFNKRIYTVFASSNHWHVRCFCSLMPVDYHWQDSQSWHTVS